ncbi:hypothetical protein ACGFX4_28375 [Kitasatospora sp. NPDC048365]|uniref:hypothetical protein n=1 Tax=Kitasatospora sp. NPDC048365 TaxID=3364050 RepID=UPI0037132C48
MTTAPDPLRLEAELAELVAGTPGVAYLSPNLLQRLTRTGGATGGVRIRLGPSPRVDVWIAVRAGHQAAATARAVRDRITAALHDRPATAAVRVRVVVTAVA